MKVDASRSRIRVRTRSVGLLARLAHDLELRVGELTGAATNGEQPEATLTIPIANLEPVGHLRGNEVEALSGSDAADIRARLVSAFRGLTDLVVHATLCDRQLDGTVRGPAGAARFSCPVHVTRAPPFIRGECSVSLASLGVSVKGPAGMFRVADAVEVLFEVGFEDSA